MWKFLLAASYGWPLCWTRIKFWRFTLFHCEYDIFLIIYSPPFLSHARRSLSPRTAASTTPTARSSGRPAGQTWRRTRRSSGRSARRWSGWRRSDSRISVLMILFLFSADSAYGTILILQFWKCTEATNVAFDLADRYFDSSQRKGTSNLLARIYVATIGLVFIRCS